MTKEKFEHQQNELNERLSKLTTEEMPTANIIVAGITGTGKSTLINAIFGDELAKTGSGRPVTENMNEYGNDEIPVHIWDTVGLELNSENTRRSIEEIKRTIAEKATTDDQFDRVHAIWYCINSGSNRYQGAELEFIKELHSTQLPFIIVLTQCCTPLKTRNEFEEKIREINKQEGMSDISIIQVLAQDYEFELDDGIHIKQAFGLDVLVDETLRRLPDFIRSSFVAAQRVSKKQKREECEIIIFEFAKAAQEGFWDKVPLINVFKTDRRINEMFRKIGIIYNTVLSEESINRIFHESGVDFSNNFWGLVSPFDIVGYNDKISDLLEKKKEEGFNVQVEDIPDNNRASRMIAFYGYTYIDSIEELWEEFTEKQLENVNLVVNNLISIMNRKLNERKAGEKK